MDEPSTKRRRSEAPSARSAEAVVEVMSLVATFFTQGEAKALLAPVSKSMRRAEARAQLVNVDVGSSEFLLEFTQKGKVAKTLKDKLEADCDEEDNNNTNSIDDDDDIVIFKRLYEQQRGIGSFDISSILSNFPDRKPWKPFANAGKVLKIGISEQFARVVVLVKMDSAQCQDAGLEKTIMKAARWRQTVAMPHLKAQAHGRFEKLTWDLGSVHIVLPFQNDCIFVAVTSPADLMNVNSWKFKAKGHFDLGEIWAKYQMGPIREGVCWADDLVSDELRKTLNNLLDDLDKSRPPGHYPDLKVIGHDGRMRGLINPAMNLYIRGISPFVPSSDLSQPPDYSNIEDRNGNPILMPTYQWLPTYFDIDCHKFVTIRNDINDLRPASAHPQIYEVLGRIFTRMIPRLESVLSYEKLYKKRFLNPKPFSKRALDPNLLERVNLAGTSLQVVVKILEHDMPPGYADGNIWHVGGVFHEHIIATCVLCIDFDEELEGGESLVRRNYLPCERDYLEQEFQNYDEAFRNSRRNELLPLGCSNTAAGRVIIYPSSHIVNLSTVRNPLDRHCRSRMLAFFVVDPEHRIVSTQEVPDQASMFSQEETHRHCQECFKERRMYHQDWALNASIYSFV
mmetsp:Transcript_14835/g.28709  ORF Transcript_14835/g.28709 Transcript_14835/m.28709 type:complete len:623 (+) Transcript_14835:162-2030(+)